MRSLADIAKHSSIYGLAALISRFASVLLLPLYTHYLTPHDYGVIAILDLTTTVLALLIGGGMAQAVTRFQFDADSADGQRRVWWTGLLFVLGMGIVVTGPLWLIRDSLAVWTIGADVPDGGFLYSLTFATLILMMTSELFDVFVRVQKWSVLYLVVSTGRLLLNVGLNVWFLCGLGMGVKGQLLGNLLATVAHSSFVFVIFWRHNQRVLFDVSILKRLIAFSSPIIVLAFLSLLMHEADRYFLAAYLSLEDVGIYSLAYKIGQAVNSLTLLPFGSIWSVTMYEIAKQPDAKQQYAAVFRHFVNAMLILMLGASLVAWPLLPILTTQAYEGAVDILPVILLAFVFFSAHSLFNVPAMLAKRTVAMLPAAVAGVVVNLLLNTLIVPHFGGVGAAWVSVATYATYSFVGLALYRRIDVIPYQFGQSLMSLLGIGATYAALRWGHIERCGAVTQIGVAIGVCSVWAGLLFGPFAWQLWRERLEQRKLHRNSRPNFGMR